MVTNEESETPGRTIPVTFTIQRIEECSVTIDVDAELIEREGVPSGYRVQQRSEFLKGLLHQPSELLIAEKQPEWSAALCRTRKVTTGPASDGYAYEERT